LFQLSEELQAGAAFAILFGRAKPEINFTASQSHQP
jgi:hypothetical protein